jgi:hypothetical protein
LKREWIGVVPLASILSRAPLEPPHFLEAERTERARWEASLMNPDRRVRERYGYMHYNEDIA